MENSLIKTAPPVIKVEMLNTHDANNQLISIGDKVGAFLPNSRYEDFDIKGKVISLNKDSITIEYKKGKTVDVKEPNYNVSILK